MTVRDSRGRFRAPDGNDPPADPPAEGSVSVPLAETGETLRSPESNGRPEGAEGSSQTGGPARWDPGDPDGKGAAVLAEILADEWADIEALGAWEREQWELNKRARSPGRE